MCYGGYRILFRKLQHTNFVRSSIKSTSYIEVVNIIHIHDRDLRGELNPYFLQVFLVRGLFLLKRLFYLRAFAYGKNPGEGSKF